ncbi:hypothetical protein OIV83_001515 [Microbotryomycetes sp. JL201]|nr:hypothetical protein OIV83_001515 [Microbotryomycetes sp. JL201]
MSGPNSRAAKATYHPGGYGVSEGLMRARKPFRTANAITGLAIMGFAVSVYLYSIRAVSQDDFSDVEAPTAEQKMSMTSIEDERRTREQQKLDRLGGLSALDTGLASQTREVKEARDAVQDKLGQSTLAQRLTTKTGTAADADVSGMTVWERMLGSFGGRGRTAYSPKDDDWCDKVVATMRFSFLPVLAFAAVAVANPEPQFGGLTSVLGDITSVAGDVASGATSVFGDVTSAVPGIINTITSGAVTGFEIVTSNAAGALTTVTSFAGSVATNAASNVESVATSLASGAESVATSAASGVQSGATSIASGATSGAGGLANSVSGALNSATNSPTSAAVNIQMSWAPVAWATVLLAGALGGAFLV